MHDDITCSHDTSFHHVKNEPKLLITEAHSNETEVVVGIAMTELPEVIMHEKCTSHLYMDNRFTRKHVRTKRFHNVHGTFEKTGLHWTKTTTEKTKSAFLWQWSEQRVQEDIYY